MARAAADALVSLKGVSRRFESGLLALDRIDFSLPHNGFTAVVGPSGCGKSTLLRVLAGLLKPSAGTMAWAEARPRIGIVFQEPTLMPWARALDNVALPLLLAGTGRREARERATAMLVRVGLGAFTRAFPRELSGGMQMRTALARALITTPHVLLLDEPFAALDEITRTALNRDLLVLWGERGGSVVFVTHSVFEAVFLAERVFVMTPRPGKFIAEIEVGAPYPREDEFRLSPAFADCARAVSAALAHGMKEAQEEPPHVSAA
jgi:NitT/TauT family transport system ATP-binding protein